MRILPLQVVKMERRQFIENISSALGRSNQKVTDTLPRWTPSGELLYPDVKARASLFVERMKAHGINVRVVSSRAEARNEVESLFSTRNWTKLACNMDITWKAIEYLLDEESVNCQFGLDEAWHAIAETGSLVLRHGRGSRKEISLVPPFSGIFVRYSSIVSRLTESFKAIEALRQDIPSAITFISGPSKSADIEMDLCIGVHGPKELFVWVIEDE